MRPRSRILGDSPRQKRRNLRALGLSPRALGKSPRQIQIARTAIDGAQTELDLLGAPKTPRKPGKARARHSPAYLTAWANRLLMGAAVASTPVYTEKTRWISGPADVTRAELELQAAADLAARPPEPEPIEPAKAIQMVLEGFALRAQVFGPPYIRPRP